MAGRIRVYDRSNEPMKEERTIREVYVDGIQKKVDDCLEIIDKEMSVKTDIIMNLAHELPDMLDEAGIEVEELNLSNYIYAFLGMQFSVLTALLDDGFTIPVCTFEKDDIQYTVNVAGLNWFGDDSEDLDDELSFGYVIIRDTKYESEAFVDGEWVALVED